MNHLNEALAKEIVRDRTTNRGPTQRPAHPRAAHALRRLADRIDKS
ncbi:MAG: hypothetical protein H0U28_13850 [Nocardioidaceae bacterium]|nr:hypothetical protein [Nocardioidaceae bacterium]